VPEQLPLDDEILALSVLEKPVGRFRPARVAGGKNRCRNESRSAQHEFASIDSIDYAKDLV
jgi:hypothetical protein